VEALALRRNPRVDALLEHIEWQGAGAEDFVVVFADVETIAECLSGTRHEAVVKLGNRRKFSLAQATKVAACGKFDGYVYQTHGRALLTGRGLV
jgi:hypothetical protein